MPRSLGTALPAPLTALLAGTRLEVGAGETFLLVTAGEEGWPHVAMLSVGELLAVSPTELRLALWPGSHTSANLARDGRALLVAVVPPATYYVRIECSPLGEVRPQRPLAAFAGSVVEVQEDVVGYARVLEGIRFELTDPAATLELWRSAIASLRSGVFPETRGNSRPD